MTKYVKACDLKPGNVIRSRIGDLYLVVNVNWRERAGHKDITVQLVAVSRLQNRFYELTDEIEVERDKLDL